MLATVTKRVNSRLEANTASKKLLVREIGETVNVVKIVAGEMLSGNRIWAIDDKSVRHWSGGINIPFEKMISSKNRVFNDFKFNSIWNKSTGENVTVCIVDSGIERSVSLEGSINTFDKNSIDGTLHGTYMAEIIAALDFDNSIFGIAPNTKLISHKISPSDLTPETLLEILNKNRDADIFNFSLNNRNKAFLQMADSNDLLEVLNQFDQANKILIAATGNEGIKKIDFKNFPAALNSFTSVAGEIVSLSSTPNLFSASNLWDHSHVLAPANSYFDTQRKAYSDFETGTSVASAFFTGMVSLIISYCKKKGLSNYKSIIKRFLSELPVVETAAVGGTIQLRQILPNSLIEFIQNL